MRAAYTPQPRERGCRVSFIQVRSTFCFILELQVVFVFENVRI
jgi:hypothetical protein